MDKFRFRQRSAFQQHVKTARSTLVAQNRSTAETQLVSEFELHLNQDCLMFLDGLLPPFLLPSLHAFLKGPQGWSTTLQQQLIEKNYIKKLAAFLKDEDEAFVLLGLDCLTLLVPYQAKAFIAADILNEVMPLLQHPKLRLSVFWLLSLFLAEQNWAVSTSAWQAIWPTLKAWVSSQILSLETHEIIILTISCFWCDKPDMPTVTVEAVTDCVQHYFMETSFLRQMYAHPAQAVPLLHDILDSLTLFLQEHITAFEALFSIALVPLHILEHSAIWGFEPALLCRSFGLIRQFLLPFPCLPVFKAIEERQPTVLQLLNAEYNLPQAMRHCVHQWQKNPILLDDVSLVLFLDFFSLALEWDAANSLVFVYDLLPCVAQHFPIATLAMQMNMGCLLACAVTLRDTREWHDWLVEDCHVLAIIFTLISRATAPAHQEIFLTALLHIFPYSNAKATFKANLHKPLLGLYNKSTTPNVLALTNCFLDHFEADHFEADHFEADHFEADHSEADHSETKCLDLDPLASKCLERFHLKPLVMETVV